jgi:hypothetical protein
MFDANPGCVRIPRNPAQETDSNGHASGALPTGMLAAAEKRITGHAVELYTVAWIVIHATAHNEPPLVDSTASEIRRP